MCGANPDANQPCEVRGLNNGAWVTATLVWSGEQDADAALLRIDDPPDDDGRVRLGRLTGSERAACNATGFPWAQLEHRDEHPVRRAEYALGMVDAVSGRAPGALQPLLTIHVDGSTPLAREEASPWAGMSGAGVVCGDALVGVVICHAARFGTDRLLAVPITRLVAAAGFADAITRVRGERPVLEAVEAQGVLDCAYDPPPPRRNRQSSAFLLGARYGVVPFRARPELNQLFAWAHTRHDFDVAVLTGPGGVGKTRMARQLCADLAAQGWVTGPLATARNTDRLGRLARVDAPVLVVVDDYAESRRGDVVDVLAELARRPTVGPRRLLLTTRLLGDWWTRLQHECPDNETRDLVQYALTIDVGAADATVQERLDAYRAAIDAFAAHTGPPAGNPDAPDLSDRLFETVLFVHMAALSAMPGADDAADPPTAPIRASLLKRTLDRERRYWARIAEAREPPLALDADVQGYAVAIATLTAPASTETPADAQQMATLLSVVPDLVADVALRRRVARWLHDLYFPRAGWIAPLEPDLLGEALVAQTLTAVPGLALDLLAQVDTPTAARTMTVLARGSHHHEACRAALSDALDRHLRKLAGTAIDVAQQVGDPVGIMLAKALQRHPDGRFAREILGRVPQDTVSLRETAAVAATQALRTSPGRSQEHLQLLVEQSNRLSELGRLEDALAAIDEAVSAYREMAEARPDAFLPDLALSLSNQCNRLTDLGRLEDALAATDEAVSVSRQLDMARPDAFRPDLAASLNNHSVCLNALGRRECALAAIDEAVTIRRDLADTDADAFLPDLAKSLGNQSLFLGALGHLEDALAAIDESVSAYRKLVEARPDAFLPDLAASLTNQSEALNALGDPEHALAAIEEAVSAYHALAASRPDAFRPNLATSLNNQAGCLHALGRREDALAVIGEAVGIRRALANARPDAFLPDLATSLNNQAIFLGGLGRREDALTAIDEAVTLRRTLANARPDAFLPALGVPLTGRRSEATYTQTQPPPDPPDAV